MAALHDALSELAPTDWSEVPQDDISSYAQHLFEAGELICNSVPPPQNGTPFSDAKPFSEKVNTAKSAQEMHASESRPYAPAKEHEDLQSQWGKPMKFSQKDNPLNVAVYKTAGHDRHGAWFARSSIHEGMGFNKFRAAMLQEFPETLKSQGGPGAGSIRGIGADQRLEKVELNDGNGDVEVYQLSAQFPGPTTPREFITLLVTSDSALSEKSIGSGLHQAPRHFMVISKPIKHDQAPDRNGYIRGQYESVELIREIPLIRSSAASKSTPNLLDTADSKKEAKPEDPGELKRSQTDPDAVSNTASDAQASSDDPELNPVEWIMVTRSDPGGGIPRFMVERGTPSAMIGDVSKFLNWATSIDEHAEHEDGEKPAVTTAPQQNSEKSQHQPSTSPDETAAPAPQQQGVLSSITHALEAGLDAYAPTMISSFVHQKLDSQDWKAEDTSDSSDMSDAASFTSATELRRTPDAGADIRSLDSESISLRSKDIGDAGEGHHSDGKKLNQHDKELIKIAKEREKLEQKLTKKREEEEERLKKAQNDEEHETTKAQERHDKEVKKQEEKYKKEMDKLEAKRAKETKKAEEKRKKQLDRDTLHKVTRERDDFRSQVDLLKRENAVLRQRLELLQPSQDAEADAKEVVRDPTTSEPAA